MLPVIPMTQANKEIDGYKMELSAFNVGLENTLLLIKNSKNPKDIYEAIIKLLNVCWLNRKDQDISKLPQHVLDMAFLELRKISNGEEFEIAFICNAQVTKKDEEDNETTEVCKEIHKSVVDLSNLVIKKNENYREIFTLNLPDNKVYIKLHQLPVLDYLSAPKDEESAAGIARHISSITIGEDVTEASEYGFDELVEWCKTLPLSIKQEMTKHFFSAMPHIYVDTSYTCKCGKEHTVSFDSLLDFFI